MLGVHRFGREVLRRQHSHYHLQFLSLGPMATSSLSSKRKASSIASESQNQGAVLGMDAVPMKDWLKECNPEQAGFFLPILDGRSESVVSQQGQLSHPSHRIVPMPIEEWKQRSFELPARHVPFLVLVESKDAAAASEFLLGPKDTPSKTRKRPQKPWRVQAILTADTITPDEIEKSNFTIHEEKSLQSLQGFPLPRLWEPDPMIKNGLLPTLRQEIQDHDGSDPARILDLASGAGRDVVFLAEELLSKQKVETFNNFVVEALDHRYNEKETSIVNGFFQRRRIESVTKCIRMDLSQWSTLEPYLNSTVKALYCVRFWKPSLVEALASSPLLSPGTLFAISHFCKPHEGAKWQFAHPSEKTVLERNQLANLFEQDWDILHDQIAMDSDHGRTMIHFVAKKK